MSGRKILAERLGYRCVSRETVLRMAAKAHGVPTEDLMALIILFPDLVLFLPRLIMPRFV